MRKSRTVRKRQRQNIVRHVRNKGVRSRLKTLERKVRGASDEATAASDLRELQRALDKAAAQGIIHPNKAARKKSRLAKHAAKN